MTENTNINSINGNLEVHDTAGWRLLLHIAADGMNAWLRSPDDPDATPMQILNASWNAEDDMIARIEQKVYDHPRVLEDFEADIIIDTPKTLFIPARELADEEFDCVEQMKIFFGLDECEPLIDEIGDIRVSYYLCDKLRCFLDRTFPGARVHSHLGLMTRWFMARAGDENTLYMHIEGDHTDIVAFKDGQFYGASSFMITIPKDPANHVLNILKAGDFDLKATDVFLSGDKDARWDTIPVLRKYVRAAQATRLPRRPDFSELPLACAIAMNIK